MTRFDPAPSRPLLLVLSLLLLASGSVGCSMLPAARTGNGLEDEDMTAVWSDTTENAEPDLELIAEMNPAESLRRVELPVGPDGYADLSDLEDLCRTAQALSAEGRFSEAEDHLFVLNDQLAMPLPAEADSSYVDHRRSLERRLVLLGAVVAEQMAFQHPTDLADSLLAASYTRLQAQGLPDSLVPATGVTLGAVTADLLKVDNKEVRRWEDYFTGRGRGSFQVWLDRKAAVDSLMSTVLTEAGLPPELIYLAMIESGFSSRAVSSAQAVGPWQFMVGTGREYDLRTNWWIDERRDVEMSTRAAAEYLTDLHARFGDWALVLAAYNTGGGRIERKIRQHGHDNFWDMRLPTQTTAHIPKFIAAARLGADPERYGFEVKQLSPLAYDILEVDDATDLALIARCAGADVAVVKELNPALLRGATPPDLKKYPVRVPRGTGAAAKAALARVPADQRLTWRRHQVQRGETLGAIAGRYGTSVGDIGKLNKLRNVQLIRPGDHLLIPMPAELASKARERSAEKGHYVPPSGYERVSYKVKSGDTLSGVARRLGVTLNHLRKVNNIHRSSMIKPGQMLYAYRPGDN